MKRNVRSILIVDDDRDACSNLSDILVDMGYLVDVAHDGLDGLALARSRSYDLALVDLKMPGLDGIQLLGELRRLHSPTVGVLITAFASDRVTRDALDLGVWRILSKPLDPSLLLEMVDDVGKRPSVLVVDDDHDLCLSLQDLLIEQGIRVRIAHDPAQAASLLGEESYDVVLIDLKLPGGDGTSVYSSVQLIQPDTRTVIITGHRAETEAMVDALLGRGADVVCYKPFDLPDLLSQLRSLLSPSTGSSSSPTEPR